ncbi:MAG: hypothetical protein AAFQ82_24045 [Myxococcota bacterium]
MRTCLILVSFSFVLGCGGEDEGESPFTFTALSRQEHTEQFPIVEGVHGASDCNDCHGGFDSFREFSCINGCHNGTGHPEAPTAARHAGISSYVWESAACFSCHPEGD